MAILVTGGAGYIGSHMALRLLDLGETVVILDNLSTGRRALAPKAARFVEGDIADRALLHGVMQSGAIEAVIHFAGSIVVPESVTEPLAYYHNNTVKSRSLIEACVAHNVPRIIFSSTAAVYGEPDRIPISESAALKPINPYGRSKLMTEWMLEDAGRAHKLGFAILRYFNVAGADPAGRSGQASPKATHLIKVACEVATGKRPRLDIFGTDYATSDGTCVRDYIHVSDLVEAHVDALRYLRAGGASDVFNCGYGRGFSVREVIDALNRQLDKPIATAPAPRRAGDPAALVAGAGKIRETLGWRPKHEDLDFIVRTALAWERKLDIA
jgi:UDP-glucose 4-epimerase